MSPPTPIYFEIRHRLEAEYVRLDRAKITHWLMHFRRGSMNIEDCRGGKITLGGSIEFIGQPREIFWDFIVPCLEDIIDEILNSADFYGRNYPVDTGRIGMDETASLLKAFVQRVLNRMIYIDQALRGAGHPASATPYDPSAIKSKLHILIDERTESLKFYRPEQIG